MSTSLTALVAIEAGPFRETLSQRLRAAGVREMDITPGADLTAIMAQAKPDLAVVHLGRASQFGEDCCQALHTGSVTPALPLLAIVESPAQSAVLKTAHTLGIDDFILSTASDAEFVWRIQALQRLRADRRLYRTREPWEHFVMTCADGILVCDATGEITFANATARALFPSELNDTSRPLDLFDSPSQAALRKIEASAGSAPAAAVQVKLTSACAGSEIAHVTVSPLGQDERLWTIRLINPSGEMDHNTIVSQRLDILGQLTGGIAHDLNNVLNAVIGGTTLLELDAASALQPQIRSILKTAKRGGDLLQQLLLFSRGSDVCHELTDLNEIARECAAIAADTFPHHVEVRFRAPQNGQFPKIEANPAQLHQILMNLCVNARDGMPNGGQLTIATGRCHLTPEEVTAVQEAKVEGDYLTVEVSDSGTGIPPEVRDRIFEPFFSTKPKGRGTGLGLPTVLRLMQLHGGFLTVDSDTDKGTAVKCYFPFSAQP